MTNSDHEEAIRFIKYMISTSAQEMIMRGEYSPEHDQYYPFRVPARKDLANALVFLENPQYLPFIAGFSNPSIDVPTALWQNVKTDYYAPGLHQIMLGSLSIEAFLNDIESEGNRLLNP
jgi:multiple sugar transport system substrate-binding protein